MPVPSPSTYLRAREATSEGIVLTFANVAGPVAPFGFLVITAFCFLDHSAVPLLFTPIALLFCVRGVWTFSYRGPRVRHDFQLFGVNLWHTEWHLDKIDGVSANLIEDSVFLNQRPRWYKLNLWSSVQQRDHTLMRSNDQEELDRLVAMINDTIKEVSANAAP